MRTTRVIAFCSLALALAGCESLPALGPLQGSGTFQVSGIAPGKSGAREVEARLGQPAEKLTLTDGDALWFYPRAAERQTIAVRFSPEGVVRSVEERLEPAVLRRLAIGKTTQKQARELLGPPAKAFRVATLGRDVWQYLVFDAMHVKQVVDLQFTADGILQEVNVTRDPTEAGHAM